MIAIYTFSYFLLLPTSRCKLHVSQVTSLKSQLDSCDRRSRTLQFKQLNSSWRPHKPYFYTSIGPGAFCMAAQGHQRPNELQLEAKDTLTHSVFLHSRLFNRLADQHPRHQHPGYRYRLPYR